MAEKKQAPKKKAPKKKTRETGAKAKDLLTKGGILNKLSEERNEQLTLELPIEELHPNPFQPRQIFHQESIKELSESIKENGFFGALLARRIENGYQIAYGERRLRAAKLAQKEILPVIVEELSDKQMLEIALAENVQREDLSPVDEAKAYKTMRGKELGYSIRDIAKSTGKSKSYISTMLSIIKYPEIAEAVEENNIPIRTAEELSKIEDEGERQRLLKEVIEGKLRREDIIAHRENKEPSEKGEDSSKRKRRSSHQAFFDRAFSFFDEKEEKLVSLGAEEQKEAIAQLQTLRGKIDGILEQLEAVQK